MTEWDPEELRAMRTVFLEEARDHLSEIDRAIEALRAHPDERAPLDQLLRELHTLKGSAGSVELDEIGRIAHALEDDAVALQLGPLDPGRLDALSTGIDRLAARVATLEVEVKTAPIAHKPTSSFSAHESIRVEVDRIEELMESAAELIFDRTRVARRVQELEGCLRDLDRTRLALNAVIGTLEAAHVEPDTLLPLSEAVSEISNTRDSLSHAARGFSEDSENLRRTSARLQAGLRRVRVMEIGRLFQRLSQPVRDLARREHKEIALTISGADTEIDKVLVEQIAEPLLHLVRNAIAHGLEAPARRRALGKPEVGTLGIRARHTGDAVEVVVADDGAGIDLTAVRQKLIATGRVSSVIAATLDEQALYNSLFQPGMSTRDRADHVAGRGVGLDAVNEVISRLGGRVRVASTPNVGTTFTIYLPLGTAVLEALLFKIAGQVYAIPAARVLEAVHIEAADLQLGKERDQVQLKGETLPLVRLGALLGVPPPPGPSTRRAGLIISHDDERFVITCDKVIGPREIVLRSLGPLLEDLPLYAGATISGAGKVQLVLDVKQLAEIAKVGVRKARPSRAPGPRRILVADDSRSIREIASLVLSQAGFAVETVADGSEAWELLQDRPYDLLITDLEMPHLDGYELIAKIRGAQSLSNLPILVVTSRSGESTRARVTKDGVGGVVLKPLKKNDLLDAVEGVLDKTLTKEY